MAGRTARKLRSILQNLGFVAKGHGQFVLGQSLKSRKKSNENKLVDGQAIWKVESWLLTALGDEVDTLELKVSAKTESVNGLVRAALRRRFQDAKSIEFRSSKQRGGTWCFVEFVDSQTSSSRGLAGFRFLVMANEEDISICLADRLYLGDYLPSNFLRTLPVTLKDALGVRAPARQNIHEVGMDLLEFAEDLLGGTSEANKLPHYSRRRTDIAVQHGEKNIVFGLRLSESQSLDGSLPVPVQILEDRLLLERDDEFEQKLVSGTDAEITEPLSQQLRDHPEQIFWLRRVLQVPEIAATVGLEQIEFGLKKEPTNLLFVSSYCRKALSTGDLESAIKALSDFVRLLANDIDEIESLNSLDYIVPATFAECWDKIETDKAILSWNRLLSRHPDSVPALGRLAKCYGDRGDKGEELRILEAIADLTKNDKEAGDAHFWLAQRYAEDGDDIRRAIEQAKSALKRNPQHYGAANLLAELLLSNHSAPEAIQVLDAIVKTCVLSKEDHAKTECRIGRIWLEDLERADLARIHFERAIKIDDRNLEAMSYLEQILRDLNNHDQLVDILNAQYRVLEETDAPESLDKLKEEIAKIYTGELGQLDKAVNLYLSSSSSLGVLEPTELAELFGFKSSHVNWPVLYESLNSNVSKLESQRDRAQLHVNLAKLAQAKLNDLGIAIRHFERAVRDGWIDAQSFEILAESLRKDRKNKKLAEMILMRLEQIPAEQKPELIRQAILLDEALSDDQVDDLCLQLMKIEPENHKYLYKRFDRYGQKGDLYRVKMLLDKCLVACGGGLAANTWIDLAIENVGRSNEETKYSLLDQLFRLRLDHCEDEIPVLNSAVDYLKSGPKQSLLNFYIKRLLANGQIPSVDNEVIESSLDEPLATANFYELAAERAEDIEEKAQLYKQAAEKYAKAGAPDEDLERCFGEYCLHVRISPEEIAELRRMVEASGNWSQFAKILSNQIVMTNDTDWKYLLWDEIGEVYWNRLDKVDEAIEALKEAVLVSPDIESSRYKLIQVLNEAGYNEIEKEHLQEYIADERCVANVAHLRKLVDRMLLTHNMAGELERLLQQHIRSFEERGESDTAGKLSDLLLERGMGEKDLRRGSFVGAVARSDNEKAREIWFSMISELTNPKEVERLFRWTKKVLEDQFTDIAWDDLVASIAHADIFKDISAKMYYELQLQVGVQLMNSDQHNEVALASLLKARDANNADKRVWVPLYLLMREYSSDEEIKEYLKDIIPRIERNLSAVRSYPITLESLKAEFDRLVGRIGDEENIAEQAFLESETVLSQAAGAENLLAAPLPDTRIEPIRLKGTPGEDLPPPPTEASSDESPSISSNSEAEDPSFESGLRGFRDEAGSLTSRNGVQVDWRQCVRSREVPRNFAALILNRAFSSAIEKHIAIQVAALVSGDMNILEDWHWKVWRSPDQFGYSRSGKERYPSDMNPDMLYSPLHRAVIYMAPAYVKLYGHRFRKSYLCRKMSVEREQLPGLIRPLDWDHPLFRQSSLVHYIATIRKQKFRAYDARGLGKKIFYEGSNRSIYIDVAYYQTKAPSILFHRIYGLLWSIKLRYFVPLHLDPSKHLYNGYMEMRKNLGDGGLSWIKNAVAGGGDPVNAALATIDRSELRRQMERVGDVTPEGMGALWVTLNEHIYRLLLAETMDVVGLFEAISGHDYIDGKKLKPLEIFDESPYMANLLDYLTYLKL